MQSARALLLEQPEASKARLRLAATIGILLDTLDALIAAHVELAELRASEATATLRARIGVTLRAASLDLQHLSIELLSNQTPSLPPDHTLASDALKREAAKLARERSLGRGGARRGAMRRRSGSATRSAISGGWSGRCPMMKSRPLRSATSISPPSGRRPLSTLKLLTVHLTPNSPVLRFALRLSLAMTAGALVAHSLSSEGHGNWILLTIAVILRAGYGLTRERRDDRIIGTLIGCLIAAAAVATAAGRRADRRCRPRGSPIVHGFARLRYRIASVGASITALVSLHLIDPTQATPILTRVADTLVGAALAQLFSHVLPRWEFNEAPRIAARLQSADRRFRQSRARRARLAPGLSHGAQEHDRGDRRAFRFRRPDGRRAAGGASRP